MSVVNEKYPRFKSIDFNDVEIIYDEEKQIVNLSKLLQALGLRTNYKELMRIVERLNAIDDFSMHYYGKPGIALIYFEGEEPLSCRPSKFLNPSTRTDETLFDKKKRVKMTGLKIINQELFEDIETVPKEIKGVYVPYKLAPMFIIWANDANISFAFNFLEFMNGLFAGDDAHPLIQKTSGNINGFINEIERSIGSWMRKISKDYK